MATFNRGITNENRTKIAEQFASSLILIFLPRLLLTEFLLWTIAKCGFSTIKDTRGKTTLKTLGAICSGTKMDRSFSNSEEFVSVYDRVLSQKGIAWNITSALYWINPYRFVTLDTRTRHYINNVLKIDYDFNLPPDGRKYLQYVSDILAI
jgi:5-methylcytosine-specific restriction protein B